MSETNIKDWSREELMSEHLYLWTRVFGAQGWLDELQSKLYPSEPEGYRPADTESVVYFALRAQAFLSGALAELEKLYEPIAALEPKAG